MSDTPTTRPTVAQVVLGTFILVQLLFLILGNAVPFFLSGMEQKTAESLPAAPLRAVRTLTAGWVDLTGQGQVWNLFAPLVPMRAMFVEVEVECAADPARLLQLRSEFEPDEQGWYLHLPGSDDRLFHYEKDLAWPMMAWAVDPERVPREPEEWREYLTGSVRKQWRAYRAYLAWRSRSVCSRPESATLSIRMYPQSRAGQMAAAKDVVLLPLVRWRPDREAKQDSGTLPLEVYNVNTGHFVPLTRK